MIGVHLKTQARGAQ